MTDSNQLGPVPSPGTTSAAGRLQDRLQRDEQGRWIEERPSGRTVPSTDPTAHAGNPPTRFGDWLVERHEPGADGHGPVAPSAGPFVRSEPGTEAAAGSGSEPSQSRRLNDTTFPLPRTEGGSGRQAESGLGPRPSAPIRGPIRPGTDPAGRDDFGHDAALHQGRYEPIEESWSREWLERSDGGPSFEARDAAPGEPGPGHGHDGDEDRLEAFGTDGRSFDEEELESGAAARRNAIEWAVVLVAATLLALVLRAVLLQAFYIPSPSMEDTLLIKDRVLVNKLSYRLHDINRGDIVVFHRTAAELELAGPDEPKDVIKRVIALPGETIEIQNNQVLINSQVLLEPYLNESTVMPDFGPEVVPEDHIFVMGDNRNLSSDSRGELGPIATDRVVGRAFLLFWPVDRLTLL